MARAALRPRNPPPRGPQSSPPGGKPSPRVHAQAVSLDRYVDPAALAEIGVGNDEERAGLRRSPRPGFASQASARGRRRHASTPSRRRSWACGPTPPSRRRDVPNARGTLWCRRRSEPFIGPPALDPGPVLILVLAAQAGRPVVVGVEGP